MYLNEPIASGAIAPGVAIPNEGGNKKSKVAPEHIGSAAPDRNTRQSDYLVTVTLTDLQDFRASPPN
jgi:hypothetical protein